MLLIGFDPLSLALRERVGVRARLSVFGTSLTRPSGTLSRRARVSFASS